jgi:hypothetical protein
MDKPEDFYANGSLTGFTAWDVTFVFQRRGLPLGDFAGAGDTQAAIFSRMDVSMSPQHAKVFAIHAMKAIKDYEARFGVIAMPKGEEEKYEAAKKEIGL